VVGDEVSVETALYFLRALEARQGAKRDAASKSFLRTVERSAPGKVGAVAGVLSRIEGEISPGDLFAAHPELVSEDEKERILDSLEQDTRPVLRLDPVRRPVRKEVRADGLVIRGPVGEMDDKVRWEATPSGWRITLDVREEPRSRYE
jgi:hypothetical protein